MVATQLIQHMNVHNNSVIFRGYAKIINNRFMAGIRNSTAMIFRPGFSKLNSILNYRATRIFRDKYMLNMIMDGSI